MTAAAPIRRRIVRVKPFASVEASAVNVSLPCEPWEKPVDAVAPEQPAVRVAVTIPSQVSCAVPGCHARLWPRSMSGVCRAHVHADGFCRCAQCRRGRGSN